MSEIVDCISWVVRKTCWSFYVCCEFVCLRVLDLLGLIFNFLACLTIIRLPCMIQEFMHMRKLSQWRFVGFAQLMIFFMDIPFILMAVLIIFLSFGLVCFPMLREIREKRIKCDYTHRSSDGTGIFYGGFKLRKLVARYFLKHTSGILCLPLLLLTLMSWRCVIVLRKLRRHNYFDWKWRKVIIVQFFQLFIDAPCVFIAFIVLLSWRSLFYIREVKKERAEGNGWSTWRFICMEHFLLLFIDFVCFLAFLLTVVTWRSPFMISELRHDCDNQWDARKAVVKQFLLVFVDLPCIICFVFVLITLWRLPRFIKNCRSNSDQWDIRLNCVCQAGMVLVDFASFLLFLIIVLTVWRLYPVIRDIRKYRRRVRLPPLDTETADRAISSSHNHSELNVISSESSWKIRKAICKHLAFLLIDLPAIILVFFIVLTVFRVPSLISKLLQSGDFYTEFAMIVYTEAAKLLIDILFVLFFIVLMIMRPVAAWVRLLEDEEHTQYRHVAFYTQWIPDMIRKTRTELPVALEEEFSSCLKKRSEETDTRARLSLVCVEHLKQWQWLHDKVAEEDLYPELPHLINTLMWYEKRRPYKMSRLYSCELLYLTRPLPSVHDESLAAHKREMAEFDERVSSAYQELENFSPAKVPLWSSKCGLLARSRKDTQKVLMGLPGGNILLFVLVFLNLVLLYRGPKLIVSLYHHWYDRRSIIFRSCKEYLLDALTFLRILVVLLSLYRAPALLLDIAIDIVQKQSWKAVRKTAKRYPPSILEDIAQLISKVLHWRTIRFLFTAVLFGILIPADLLLTVLKLATGKCCAYFITALLFSGLLFFPFAFAFHFGSDLLISGYGIKITYIVSAFVLLIVALLVVLFFIFLKQRGTRFSVAPKPYDYIRLNWANAHVVIFEIVELLQLVALVFSIDNIPMVGSGFLSKFANYLLFNFASFEVKLSLTVIGFFVWFIACGAPVIFEHILEEFPKGTCAKNDGWRLLMVLFYNTLFVSMFEGLCGLVACDYVDICIGNNITNNTCYTSSLSDEPTITCWQGNHRIIALFSLWGLVWYAITSIIYGTQYGEMDSVSVDIEFSPVYNTIVNLLKAIMVAAVVLLSNTFDVIMVVLLVLGFLAILLTVFFKRITGYRLCNSTVVSISRVSSFVILIFAIISAMVAKKFNDETSFVPLVILLAGGGVTLLLTFVAAIKFTHETETEKERKQFRETLLALEKKLCKDGSLVRSWDKQKQRWRRLVRHVYQAQKFDRDMRSETWERMVLPDESVPPTLYIPPPPMILGDIPAHNPTPPPIIHSLTDYPPPPLVVPPDPAPDSTPALTDSFGTPEPSDDETVTNEFPSEAAPTAEDTLKASLPGEKETDDEKHEQGVSDPAEEDQITSETGHTSSAQRIEAVDPSVIICSYDVSVAENSPDIVDRFAPYGADDFLDSRTRQLRHILEESSEKTSMSGLECNGKNLLLYLEDFINFRAFSFAFVSQIPLWRQAANGSNWTGLLHCLQVLEKALTGNYNKPTDLDVSLGDPRVPLCLLKPDVDQGVPPVLVAEPRDAESIKRQSDREREKALEDLQRVYVDQPIWIRVFEKVLPTIPIIRRWSFDEETNNFELVLRRSCQATITDVGAKGIKLAKGALIAIPKTLRGNILGNQELIFEKGCEPVGKKGPISVTVSEIRIIQSSNKTYFSSSGKKVNVEKALDSMKSLQWN